MIIMKIFFLILIIISIIFYIMYLWNFSLVLMVTVIAIPIIMLIISLITRKYINIEFATKNDIVTKNESFPVQIKITNRCIFPVGKAEVHIEYKNNFDNEVNEFILFTPVQAHNVQNISFKLSSEYCGVISVRCAYVNIYDPLKIFCFKIGRNINTTITVMPEGHDISGEICSTDRINDESEIFSEYKAGDDPSEVFDLREYNAGDKLNRIHWKLSSKKDDFIVKDYSLPIDTPCTLFLNLQVDSDYTLAVFDTLIETLLSLSQFMLENERIHTIVYYNPKYKEFTEINITDAEELSEAIKEILMSASNMDCESPQEYFIDKNDFSLSSLVFISSDTEKVVLEYIANNVDAEIKNAVVIVTSQEEAENLYEEYTDINIIPVIIGRITASIKDIQL